MTEKLTSGAGFAGARIETSKGLRRIYAQEAGGAWRRVCDATCWKVVDSMATARNRSRNSAGAIGVNVILATVWIYLTPKSISLPQGAVHEVGGGVKPQAGSEAPPGAMRLLPGCTHTPRQGLDTQLGRIVKQGGPTISYEIGGHRADIMDPGPQAILWSKTQVIQGKTVRVAMKDGGRLLIDPGLANFVATDVKTQEDQVDVLLIVLTFDVEAVLRELENELKRVPR
jgi:hypothetical protein